MNKRKTVSIGVLIRILFILPVIVFGLGSIIATSHLGTTGGGGAPADGAIGGPLAEKPQIVSDGNGNFMAMWQAGLSIWARYYAGGSGEPVFRLGDGRSSDEDNAPHVAMSSNGNAFVVWRGDTEGQAATRRYIAAQDSWEEMKTIPPTLPLRIAPVILAPNIAADSLGNFFAAFLGWDGLAGTSSSIYVSRHNDSDENWFFACNLDQFDVAPRRDKSDFPITPRVALDRHQPSETDRRALIVWASTDPNEPGIKAVRVSQSTFGVGGVTGGRCFRNLTPVVELYGDQVSSQGHQVATNNNGTVIAVWLEIGQLSSARYDFASDTWSAVQVLDFFTTTIASTIFSDPQIAMNASSNAFAVWVNQKTNRIDVRRHLGGADWAVAWEPIVEISDANAPTVLNPHVAIDFNGNAIVVWEQDGEVYYSYFDASANAWSASQSIGEGMNPKVAIEATGTAIIVWEQDGFIYDFIFGPPTASFTFSPVNPAPGEQVSFDASASRDDDGQIVQYEWDFEDEGTFDATEVTATTTYPTVGTFTIRLRVTDDDGLTNEITSDIIVGQYSLTVTKDGNGSGTVTSDDGNINCGGDCLESYTHGDSVTLTAVPDPGSVFSSWDCGGTPTTLSTIEISMTGPASCTATFTLDVAPGDVTLTVTLTNFVGEVEDYVRIDSDPPCQRDDSSCTKTVPVGTEVIITRQVVTTDASIIWGGCDSEEDDVCHVTMNANRDVTAVLVLP